MFSKEKQICKYQCQLVRISKLEMKHCQRHSGPRVFSRNQFVTWFQFRPPGGATCISCKFGLQMALLVLLVNVAHSWCFLHHQAYNGYKFSHQMAPLALFPKLATRSRHLRNCIATLLFIALFAMSVGMSWYIFIS